MVRIKRILFALAACLAASVTGPCRPAFAGQAFDGVIQSKPAQAVPYTDPMDVSRYDRFSAQVTYADGTPPQFTVLDGTLDVGKIIIKSTAAVTGATVTIGTTTLTWGSGGISTGTTTSADSINLAAAARANSFLNSQFFFSTGTDPSGGVTYATATTVGARATTLSASTTNTYWTTPYTVNGSSSNVSITNDSFYHATHLLTSGMRIWFSTSAGTAPTGLTAGGTYYAVVLNDNEFGLATSTTLAVAGTKVDITAVGGGSTIKIFPQSLVAGSAGFRWQASNDGTNFVDLNIASVTYTAAGSSLWDFGANNYRILRFLFVGPTSGGISLVTRVSGSLR